MGSMTGSVRSHNDFISKGQYLKVYGKCVVEGCTNPRIRMSLMCIDHEFDHEAEFMDVTLVYSYTLNCIFCSFQKEAIGTRAQERVARMLITIRCPVCNNPLSLEDERRVIGRIITDKGT